MPAYRHYFCPFCRVRCQRHDRHTHRRQHEEEFSRAYATCGEELGLNIAFGRSRHSLGCCFHTVQFLHPNASLIDPRRYVTDLVPAIRRILQLPFLRRVRLRTQFNLYITFYRRTLSDDEEESEEVQQNAVFRSHRFASLTEHSLDQAVSEFLATIIPNIEAYCNQNSGWMVQKIEGLSIAFVCGRNDSGGSPLYTTPPSLAKVRWSPNIRGIDGECFPDAVRYCLAHADGFTDKHALRDMNKIRALLTERYPLNLEGMPLPFEFKYFKAFEARNPTIGLRIYHHDRERITGPLYVNTDSHRQQAHLLFIAHPEKDVLPGHFRPITNMRAMINSLQKEKTRRTPFFCEFCLQSFQSEHARENHLYWCTQSDRKQTVEMPEEVEHRFKDHQKTTRLLNIIYADMESKIDPDTHEHTPGFVGAKQVWHPHFAHEHDTTNVDIFKGNDCVMQFLNYIEEKAHTNMTVLDSYTRQPMKMSEEEQHRHQATTHCDFCEKPFNEERVRCADHDHITGAYLHALCSDCNLRRVQYRRRMSVVFHNLKGYDGHHLMRYGLSNKLDWEIAPIYQSGDKLLGVIARIPLGENDVRDEEEEEEEEAQLYNDDEMQPPNKRRRKSKLSYYTVNFIDSFQFLPSSLAKLVETLPDTPISRQVLAETYGLSMADGQRISKGTFPYTAFTSFDALSNTTELPPISAFYNDLTEKACSPETYAVAEEAWHKFDCKSLEDFLVSYLTIDVSALADIFENFRHDIITESGLDPAHFFGSPGLSMAWCFKHTKARPDTLRDPAMYEMFERGVRGGMTFVNIHEATAPNATDQQQQQKHVAYIDENNLYGNCMRQKLPYKDFKWMSKLECDNLITTYAMKQFNPEGDFGFLAEVDLEYPTEVQDSTLDLPLAPEMGSISEEELSPYMKHLWTQQYGKHAYRGSNKLLLTHHHKKHYIVHSRALHYYVEKGLRITQCHRAIVFRQEAFMQPYVDYHTEQRSKATTPAKKNMHKFVLNANFGKTMEDVRKHLRRLLTHSPSILFRNAFSPLCDSVMPLGPETVVVTMRKTSVLLNKPIYIGQCILDASKIIMYQLLDQLKVHPTLSDVKLIGGDTDSFFLLLRSPHSLDDIWRSFPNLDTSNYPPSHPLYSNKNKARLGCFKDEACGQRITSFIALSPKMYSFLVENDASHNRAKGVKSYKKATLTHDLYRQACADQRIIHVNQTLLQSREHTIHTITQRKRALCVWEDKRVWLSPNVSYPYGYHRLPSLMQSYEEIPAKRPRL